MNYQDWIESIHQKDGISKQKEREIRSEVVNFMTYFGIVLNLPQKTIAKGIYYFHRVSKQISFKRFDRILYGAVCVYLSSKIDDRLRSLKDAVRAYLYVYNIYKNQKSIMENTNTNNNNSNNGTKINKISTNTIPTTIKSDFSYDSITKEGYQAFKPDLKALNEYEEKFCNSEFEILKLLGFKFDVELPYAYLDIIKSHHIIPHITFLKIANNFINDSMRTLVCLYYEPRLIALAALNLAQFYCNNKLPDVSTGTPWYKCFGQDVEMEIIEEVTSHIMELYKQDGVKEDEDNDNDNNDDEEEENVYEKKEQIWCI